MRDIKKKVCFCGLGSIGKRHFKNLQTIAWEQGIFFETHALRKTDKVLEEEIKGHISRQIFDENQLDNNYDIVFITNPTNLHYDTIRTMADKTKHMFIEKPIFDSKEYRLEALNFNKSGVYYVAGPLRFSSVIQKLRDIIPHEKIYCVRVICSSYLPDWRPNVDYRLVYSASKEKGGGVAIDLIHEWDYITYLFGFPKKVFSICGKYSHLEIDSEDLAVYIAEYNDKVVELHLDYFGREHRREIEIFTKNGTITCDLVKNIISFTDDREQIHFDEAKNEFYLREMRFFIDNILKNNCFNNIQHSYSVLNLALGRNLM
ncbi:MAG: Gfo/Idh/MocA family oxidoreductase [Clostridiaceae bacterium]|nr:Gfo/Idh/MocA family oxidoreductase [Clostridiaceae bacterium]